MSGASSASAMPYIGSKISLITNSELRYEGTLVNINTSNSTVTLRDVRMSGTENRRAPHFVMPSPEIFDYIVFNGKDIKDLTVSEPGFSVREDPAVVAVNIAPPAIAAAQAAASYPPPMQYRGPVGPGGYGGHHPGMGGADIHHGAMNHRGGAGGGYGSPSGGGRGYMRRMDGYHPHDVGHHRKIGGSKGGGVVGELSAQPNSSLKTQVAATFNFEESNSKFVKGADLQEAEAQNLIPKAPVYDKNQSFFDNISCETLNRQHGRDSKVDRDRQRELDTETFGSAAAMSRGPRYYRRGYRRGGGGPMRRGAGGPGLYGTSVRGMGYSAGYGPYGRYGKQHVKAQ